ncbi:MAG: MgtC/SapB family protein [Wenzhouxiangellaceae bacterium]|nr:MgtC/SapB family protein [Wenzhouxiangellaceae bacterium]
MESELAFTDMLVRLLAAAGLASIIGLERELQKRPAGLRTHMLVALGAAAFMLVGYEILFATAVGDPNARIDPTRIVEGVIGGIGFLGAGSIIQARGSVQGVTTGAAIWLAGAIGVACGVGNYILASMITGIALVIMVALGFIEHEYVGSKSSGEDGGGD